MPRRQRLIDAHNDPDPQSQGSREANIDARQNETDDLNELDALKELDMSFPILPGSSSRKRSRCYFEYDNPFQLDSLLQLDFSLQYDEEENSLQKKRGRPQKDSSALQSSLLGSHDPSYGMPTIDGPVSAKPPTEQVLKALPAVKDHTTDRLNPEQDEFIPHKFDAEGEKKVLPNGRLLGNREYRVRTFVVLNRGDKLFMLATECAKVLAYKDSYLLFNQNRSLYQIIADEAEEDDLVEQEILPYSYQSRQIAIVTARSMFRQFGSQLIEHGRGVRDDYWEAKAKEQGSTEDDPAEAKLTGNVKVVQKAQEFRIRASSERTSHFTLSNLNSNTKNTSKDTSIREIYHSRMEDWIGFDEYELRLLSDLSVTEVRTCCQTFVAGLLSYMKPCKNGEKVVDHVVQMLPDLLYTFAIYLKDNRLLSDTKTFIFKYTSEICTIFREQWLHSDFNLDKKIPEAHILPSDVAIQSADGQHKESSNTHHFGESSATRIERILRESKGPMIQTPAYEWLTTRLCSSFRLTIPEISKPDNVHESVLHYLLDPSTVHRSKIGSRSITRSLSMEFELDFDLKEIWDAISTNDEDAWEEILGNCITLTSDGENIQALTCLQYLEQTWPLRGSHLLSMLTLLRCSSHATHDWEDAIDVEVLNGKTLINVSGAVWLIAEIAEQFAWLGSAFRTSSVENSVHQCTAKVTSIGKNTSTAPLKKPKFRAEHCCTISYTVSTMEQNSTSSQCWQGLFKYPVVATQFPIARKDATIPGVEMTLSAMVALCRARHIGKFEHSIVIKGFSSMFTLTERQPGLSIWHFQGSLEGDYIPYPDATKLTEFRDLGIHEIVNDRHFVGWCSKSTYGAGAVDSNYEILHSGLLGTSPGYLLHEKSIRRGLVMQEEKVFLLGDKKSPRRTYQQTYFERLMRLHSRPVVLWDTDSQRGWLTNGTSALLHLIFASLENDAKDKNGPFAHAFQFQRSNIKHSCTHTDGSAAKILLEEDNLNLEILSYGGERRFFKDRVENLLFLLELMIEYQTAALQTARSPFICIEGWDFMDTADLSHEVLHPRAFIPDKDSSGWNTLLKDTCAVTLYGRNFGEIYKPVDCAESCVYWTKLPTDKFYVAASIPDLERIIKGYNGDHHGDPIRLTENTCWPSLSSTFEICECDNVSPKHRNLVQILVPRQMFKNHKSTSNVRPEIPKSGTVIFGQVTDHCWFRGSGQFNPKQKVPRNPQIKNDTRKRRRSPETRTPSTSVDRPVFHDRDDYLAAIICALPKELLAVRLLFDQIHKDIDTDEHDSNRYAFGRISDHNIVAACLPSGSYGTCSAANVASQLRRSFPKIKFCLVVGIGGGIPSSQNDIRLGDVVISHPTNGYTGVIKYDFEKVLVGKTPHNIGGLDRPPEFLLAAISALRSDPDLSEEPLRSNLEVIAQKRPNYSYPGRDLDRLYASNYSHSPLNNSCSQCVGEIVHREPRKSYQPSIHYGLIASGDKVVKDPVMRDRIGEEFNAICIEMEAAGIANIIPSLIIRGICDYSDSHKHKIWQEYACASAAAYAKVLLQYIKHRRNGEV